eukprot:756033-Hanusia_phi.AAC.3
MEYHDLGDLGREIRKFSIEYGQQHLQDGDVNLQIDIGALYRCVWRTRKEGNNLIQLQVSTSSPPDLITLVLIYRHALHHNKLALGILWIGVDCIENISLENTTT